MSTPDPKAPQAGAEVIELDAHRTAVAGAKTEGAEAANARARTLANICTAAGRMDLLAGFLADTSITVEAASQKVAEEAATADRAQTIQHQRPGVSVPKADDTPTPIDTDAIYAKRRQDTAAAYERRHGATRH